jgi:hypothetical protein
MDDKLRPWPNTGQWRDIPLQAYCLADINNVMFKIAKETPDTGRCLRTGKPVKVSSLETTVIILDYPQPHVCIHEAGHFVFSLEQSESIYISDGIFLDPYSPDGGVAGRWNKRSPIVEIQLALIGPLAQIKMAPASFETGLLDLFRTSVILDPNEKRPADVIEGRWSCLGGAREDLENARHAAREIRPNDSEQAVVSLLRDQECHLKEILNEREFCEKIQLVAEDIPCWLKNDGRPKWEEAIAYRTAILYPRLRALEVLAAVGF